jgi:predicted nucleic acid-binding protein
MTVEYLADRSALTRIRRDPVAVVLEPLITRGLVAICAPTEFELLTEARSFEDYERLRTRLLPSFLWVPCGEDTWNRARDIHRELARAGKHRCASVPDLLVAAAAQVSRRTVLHYDRDFETIASVTGQPTSWVVPPGSVP